jgi:hypothetical protein
MDCVATDLLSKRSIRIHLRLGARVVILSIHCICSALLDHRNPSLWLHPVPLPDFGLRSRQAVHVYARFILQQLIVHCRLWRVRPVHMT